MKTKRVILNWRDMFCILKLKECRFIRLMNPQPTKWASRFEPAPFKGYGKPPHWIQMTDDENRQCGAGKPLHSVGDILWIAEAWRPFHDDDIWTCIQYRADESCVKPTEWDHDQGAWCEDASGLEPNNWRSSSVMPKWASRFLIEITNVSIVKLSHGKKRHKNDAFAWEFKFKFINKQ